MLTFSSFALHDIIYMQSFPSTHPHFLFKNQNYKCNLAHDTAQSWALGKTELIFKTQSPNLHKLQLSSWLCMCLSISRGSQRKSSWAAPLTHGSTRFLHFLDAAGSEPALPLYNMSCSTEGLVCPVTHLQPKIIHLLSPHLYVLQGARKKWCGLDIWLDHCHFLLITQILHPKKRSQQGLKESEQYNCSVQLPSRMVWIKKIVSKVLTHTDPGGMHKHTVQHLLQTNVIFIIFYINPSM